MFMVLKKKKIAIYMCIVLVVICCFISAKTLISNKHENIVLSDGTIEIGDIEELSPGDAITVSKNDNYFFKTKSDKELVRSKSIDILKKIADDVSSTPDAKSKAENQLIEIANNIEKEFKIESIMSAKGFEESVVFISDGVTTVAVKTDKLSQDEAAKINDIALEITTNNNIKIVEVN